MNFVMLWILSTVGAFTLIMTALVLLYIAYVMWQDRRQARPNEPVICTAGAAYDACEDEPTTDHDARAYALLKKNGLLT